MIPSQRGYNKDKFFFDRADLDKYISDNSFGAISEAEGDMDEDSKVAKKGKRKSTAKMSIAAASLLSQRPFMTFDEAVVYLSTTKGQLYKLTSNRAIRHYKPMGKKVYFAKEDLDAWVLRNQIMPMEEIEKMAEEYCRNHPIIFGGRGRQG